ncbi:MAG: PAS domain-containing protein [Nitrospiraceae bacterium]
MAQQRLRDSEERYALALEGTSDGIWDWNPITGELYLSRRWKELLGFAESELPNNESAFFSRIHPDDAQAVGLAVREHLGHGVPYDVECRLLHRDGSYRWVRSRAKALRNEAGEVYRMVGTISDITERKILELDAQRWKQVFEQAEFGLAYGDVRTNTILSVNQAFARQLGYRIDELVGQPILNIYAPEARALIKGRLEAADRGGHLSYESIYQRKDGTIFPVWIEVTVIRDERGQPISRVAYAKDITEGKRAERALIDREAELRMALEAAEEGTFDYNVREDRTIFSEKALAMFGFGPQDRATYDDCISRVHHDDRPRVSEWFAQCMREKTEYQAEYRVELPNGEVKWIFAKGRGVYDQAGELERALGVLLDITERKLAERALLASEERYRHLFMASPHPMGV